MKYTSSLHYGFSMKTKVNGSYVTVNRCTVVNVHNQIYISLYIYKYYIHYTLYITHSHFRFIFLPSFLSKKFILHACFEYCRCFAHHTETICKQKRKKFRPNTIIKNSLSQKHPFLFNHILMCSMLRNQYTNLKANVLHLQCVHVHLVKVLFEEYCCLSRKIL